MTNHNSTELELRYAALQSDDLVRILTKDFHEYTPEALEIVHKELVKRGITDIEIPTEKTHKSIEEKESNPNSRLLTRSSLYVILPIIWLFFLGFYGKVREDLKSNFDILALTDTLLIFILIAGFFIITKETRKNNG